MRSAGIRSPSAPSSRRLDSIDGVPDALVALFAALDEPPAWIDRDRCDRAAESLARQPREYGLALGAASLVSGAQNTVAGKPLTFTGRYASNAAVRSIEAGSWLLAVTTPGGLQRDALGFEHTVRVRMIHARVRAHLRDHRDWRLEQWGLPIPQPYMAFTLAEFCSIALRAMERLGVRYSDRELERLRAEYGVAHELVDEAAQRARVAPSRFGSSALG